MIQKPFVKVTCVKSGVDWSDFITHFKYEDCTDKANMLEIRFSDNYALAVIDSPDFQEKSELEIQWGYTHGQVSKVHRCIVQDIDARYAQSISATIRCLDKTKAINSQGVSTIWENKTSSQIATEIAKKYGMDTAIESTSKLWDNIPQANMTDFELLKYLANREKDGNYQSFVRGTTLFFQKVPLDSKANWIVQYGDEDFLEFTPRNRNSTKGTSDDGVKLVGMDSFNKEVLVEMVGKDNLVDQTDLGTESTGISSKVEKASGIVMEKMSSQQIAKHSYDVNGERIPDSPVPVTTVVGAEGLSKGEKTNLGNKIVKKGQSNKNTGTLIILGNPQFEAGQIVTMKRVAKKHAGNWQITKVDSLIDSAGYKTSCELSRPTSVKGSKNKVNTTEGTKSTEKEQTVKVRKYDANGNEIK